MSATASAHPNDIKILSVREVIVRRRRVQLEIVVGIRTRQPQVVEDALTLASVNRALGEAGMPAADTMRVETVEAGGTPSALAAVETETRLTQGAWHGDVRVIGIPMCV